jgi:hypothetical protein
VTGREEHGGEVVGVRTSKKYEDPQTRHGARIVVGRRGSAPVGFGLSQNDEFTESRALDLPGGSVLSITSAGDMALSLRALGAERVTAVDIEPSQNHLARLKQATVVALDPLGHGRPY